MGQQEKKGLQWGQKQHWGQKQQMLNLGPCKETKEGIKLLRFRNSEQSPLWETQDGAPHTD